MLKRERRVFMLIVGVALAIVFTARVAVPSVDRAARSLARYWGWPRAGAAALAATPQESMNPALAGPAATAHATVTPGTPECLVCASYYRSPASPDYVQGAWTDDSAATESLQSCYEWMDHHILHKEQCAQPGGTAIMIVLVDKSRHTFDLRPDLNRETEFVAEQDCLP